MTHSFYAVNKKTLLYPLVIGSGLIITMLGLVIQKQDKIFNMLLQQQKQLSTLSEIRNSVAENKRALKEINSFTRLASKAGTTNSSWLSCKDQVKLHDWAVDSLARLEDIKRIPVKKGGKK